MNKTNNLKNKLLSDIALAKKKFEFYEKLYLGINGKGKEYLQNKSRTYKKRVQDIQALILPSIKKNCPTCENFCCKLHLPELNIYIAGSVGTYNFANYILVRCDTVLPEPDLKNMEKNLCPFWANGCILPPDCRGYTCLQYFCDKLKKEIDMQLISNQLEVMRSLLNNFSIQECLNLH